jgi:putative phosphoesterase
MRIAVLSDIHDNIWNLNATLARLPQAEALICCGDLCSPFVVNLLAEGFPDRPVHLVFGNNDGDTFRISAIARRFPQFVIHGEFFQGELGGKAFAVTHFDNLAWGIIRSGRYDVVCFGHNHCYQVEKVGSTLAINPGPLMGYDPINKCEVPPTFVIFDTISESAQGYQVSLPGGGVSPHP